MQSQIQNTAVWNASSGMMWHLTQQGRKTGYDITDIIGILPDLISDRTIPAQDQIAKNYAFGGGWSPLPKFTFDPEDLSIHYPGDPKMEPLAFVHLDDQIVFVYESGWVAVTDKPHDKPDQEPTLVGVTRMD